MSAFEPDYGTLYVLLDEDGMPYAMATYLDLVMLATEDDVEIWPKDASDVELLLWAYDAHETGRTVAQLERAIRQN